MSSTKHTLTPEEEQLLRQKDAIDAQLKAIRVARTEAILKEKRARKDAVTAKALERERSSRSRRLKARRERERKASQARAAGVGGQHPQKRSLYLDGDVHDDMMDEAARQGRKLSWLVQQAWEIAKSAIAEWPAYDGHEEHNED